MFLYLHGCSDRTRGSFLCLYEVYMYELIYTNINCEKHGFFYTIYKVAIIYFPVLEILKSFRIGDSHRSAQYQHENMGDDRNVSSSDYGNDNIG